MTETLWNGLPTPARKVTGVVRPWAEGDPPAAWWRHLVGQRVDAVEVVLDGVNYGGGVNYLFDGDGSGWAKVTEHKGSPWVGHRDIALMPESIEERDQ